MLLYETSLSTVLPKSTAYSSAESIMFSWIVFPEDFTVTVDVIILLVKVVFLAFAFNVTPLSPMMLSVAVTLAWDTVNPPTILFIATELVPTVMVPSTSLSVTNELIGAVNAHPPVTLLLIITNEASLFGVQKVWGEIPVAPL